MFLDDFISDLRESITADYIGAANLAPAKDFIRNQGGDYVAEFSTSISIGIILPNDIVDLLPQRNERSVQVSYQTHAYSIINNRLNLLASEVASRLQCAGHRAFPVSASELIDDTRICASFSHKLAASLSGLGWIGKSCLLITPNHGPRVRWTSVLTDVPLASQPFQQSNRCGSCTKCVDICPAEAFTGRQFNPQEPRESRYLAERCDRYFREMESKGSLRVCGLCLFVCPFGTKSRRKQIEKFPAPPAT